MVGNVFVFVILPILVIAIYTGLHSWLWRAVFAAVAVFVVLVPLFPGSTIALPVVLIILIAIKGTLDKVSGG